MPVDTAIAVVNAGSSSVKFSLFSEDGADLAVFLSGQFEGLYTDSAHFVARGEGGAPVAERRWEQTLTHDDAMRHLLAFLREHPGSRRVAAIGHRFVHGGAEYTGPVRLDTDVLARLARLVPLAPLHQPHNLAPVRAVLATAPDVVQVGCFDTAFHASQPPLAQAFALPAEITGRGVRRYGFHGLSYEYIASVLPRLDPRLAEARVIVAHLGNGASLCAMRAGRSVASSMGFTAVDGVPMGTRSGSLDPGVILYLIDEMNMGPREIERLIYKQSGLLGVSGISSDLRTLQESPDARAKLAIDLFVYRIGREIGSLAAALGGLDALVFTAGIGEHSAAVRAAVCRDAAWLGLQLDAAANAGGAARISAAESRVSAWKVPTNEELMIARHTRQVCAAGQVFPAAERPA